MSATFVTYGDSACFHYRAHLPAVAIGGGYFMRDTDWEKEEVYVKRRRQPLDNHTIVYHMPFRDWQLEELQMMKEKGHRILADVDDSLQAVIDDVPDHPSRHIFVESMPRHLECLKLCDGIIASTPFLADEMTMYSRGPVYLAENGMDHWRFNIRNLNRTQEKFVIGWAGGIGHEDSWRMIGPQLATFLRTHPDSVLLVMGQVPPLDCGLEDEDVQAQCQHVEWGPMADYPPWLAQFSVGLAPSMPTDFYRAKSPLRLLEYQASRVCTLASPTTYADHVVDGSTGFIVEDDKWLETLERMYHEPKLRKKVALQGHLHLKGCATIEHTKPQWKAAVDG